jgi:two-component system, NtrC family, nitrogen regulation sensor histidine kinase NtrY
MKPSIHRVRKSQLSRGMKYLVALILMLGAIMLYLLSSASSNTPMFARDLPLLLFFGVAVVLGLMVLVGYQLLALRRRLVAGLFGSKLTLRLVLLFSLVSVFPGVLVYAVSVQFLNKSIESWFDVRVDKALEGGLSLGRTILDNMLKDLTSKAGGMTQALADASPSQQIAVLNNLREQMSVQEATLFHPDGTIIAFSISEGAGLMPRMISPTVARKVVLQQPYRAVESEVGQGLHLRVVVPVNKLSGETGLLQLVQSVPPQLARDAETVQSMYQDYQELSLSRQGLKRLYGLSLTLGLLLALLSALSLAIVFSERLSAPLSVLAAGTRAVAQGDFSQRHPVRSHDELGILTESFNTMTTQLAEARALLLRNHDQLEAAKAYLESILAKLSAGVLSFDSERRLRSANPSAEHILGVELGPFIGSSPAEWGARDGRLAEVGSAILDAIDKGGDAAWEEQLELGSQSGGKKVLLLRGSTLQVGSESGFVLVFDDVTRLLQAQRYAAWGEVARRLAHEIKNPLTPIQLSAERLTHRLADKLGAQDAEMLTRATQTIVAQVAQLKGMVDAFSQYARIPELNLEPLDLNELIREVLVLYEAHGRGIVLELDENLPRVEGDRARLRQVIHNLLQNAEQAVAELSRPRIVVRTQRETAGARLAVYDNGTGFPPDILARAFEPYVTTKARGTGLGLAIVKKIVEEHSGTIEIRNLQPAGAEIAILLPASREQRVTQLADANVNAG